MKLLDYLKGMAAGALVLGAFAACSNKAEAGSNIAGSGAADNAAAPKSETAVQLAQKMDAGASKSDIEEKYDHSTPSGLRYRVLKEGTGKSPTATDVVLVDYEGKFVDGTVFDSSYQRHLPISFSLDGVIAGWTEGLQLMKEGAAYEFYIPYNLAYGEKGGGPIPPKADLIFIVELHEVQ